MVASKSNYKEGIFFLWGGGGSNIFIFIILFCTIFSFIYNKNNFFIIYIQKRDQGVFFRMLQTIELKYS